MGAGIFFGSLVSGYAQGMAKNRERAQGEEDQKRSERTNFLQKLAGDERYMDNPENAKWILDSINREMNGDDPNRSRGGNRGKGGKGGKENKGMDLLHGMADAIFSNKPKHAAPEIDQEGLGKLANAPQEYKQSQEAHAKSQEEEQYSTGRKRLAQQADEIGLKKGTPEYINYMAGRNLETKPPSAQKIYYKAKGSEEVHVAEHVPGQPGFKDAETGDPLPEGWTVAGAPSAASGRDLFTQYVKSYQAKYPALPVSAVSKMAGETLLKEHGVRIGRVDQQMAIDAINSGVGGGTFEAKPPKGTIASSTESRPSPGMPKAQSQPQSFPAQAPAPAPAQPKASPQSPAQSPMGGKPTPGQPGQAPGQSTPQAQAPTKPTPPPSGGKYPPLAPLASRVWRQITGLDKEPSGGPAQAGRQLGMEQLKKSTGKTDSELLSIATERKAIAKALSTAQERSALFDRLNRTIAIHGNLMQQAAKGVTPSGIPWMNMKINELKNHFTDDPRLKAFETSILAVQREYGQMVSGGVMSRAMPPVGSMAEAQKLVNDGLTLNSMNAMVGQMRKEAAGEQVAYKDQISDLRHGIEADPREEAIPYGRYMVELPEKYVQKIKSAGQGLQTIYKNGQPVNVVYRNGHVWEVE